MTSVQRDATVATAVLGLLAAASMLVGLTGVLPGSLSPNAARVLWVATGGLFAMAGAGMTLRRTGGWYLAFLALLSLVAVGFIELVAGKVYGFLTLAVAGFEAWELVRASAWFPGAEHRRDTAHGGHGGFGAPLDASR